MSDYFNIPGGIHYDSVVGKQPEYSYAPSAIDYACAMTNAFHSGKTGYLRLKDGEVKGRILSMMPVKTIQIDGQPGCVILTEQQFNERWRFENEGHI